MGTILIKKTGMGSAKSCSYSQIAVGHSATSGQVITPKKCEKEHLISDTCEGIDNSGCQEQEDDGCLLSMSMSKHGNTDSAWIEQIAKTPATKLRGQYKHEANCHKAMMRRAKKGKLTIHPDLQKFSRFLIVMGKAPTPSATIDRIDPHDPEYAPGKVRWADKSTQANNKTNTLNRSEFAGGSNS